MQCRNTMIQVPISNYFSLNNIMVIGLFCILRTFEQSSYNIIINHLLYDLLHHSTCTSSGLVACTLRACVDTCSLPSESGLCQAYFPSYFFNSRTGLCERFVYGGCGGNDNRFSTAAECYRRCNASSELIGYRLSVGNMCCLVILFLLTIKDCSVN